MLTVVESCITFWMVDPDRSVSAFVRDVPAKTNQNLLLPALHCNHLQCSVPSSSQPPEPLDMQYNPKPQSRVCMRVGRERVLQNK